MGRDCELISPPLRSPVVKALTYLDYCDSRVVGISSGKSSTEEMRLSGSIRRHYFRIPRENDTHPQSATIAMGTQLTISGLIEPA